MISKKTEFLEYINKNGKDKTWMEFASMFNFTSPDSVRKYYKGSVKPDTYAKRKIGKNTIDNIKIPSEVTIEESKTELKVSAYYDHPPTAEELIKDHNIDTNIWDLDRFYTKGKFTGWTATCLFVKKLQQDKNLESFMAYLSNFNPPQVLNPPITRNTYLDTNKKHLLVISLCDFHIDKPLVNSIGIEERKKLFLGGVKDLTLKASYSHNLDEILFVIGNDFFHTDTVAGTTTKLTTIETSSDISWYNAYEHGFELLYNAIQFLRGFSNKLSILLVPGNHSRSKEYYLAHALDKVFEDKQDVQFFRSPELYKVYLYGQTLLCFNHGDNINDKLPLYYASKFYEQWGSAKFKEILLGDKHHNNEKKIMNSQGEAQGIRMRILPTLTGIDLWHYDNLYTNSIEAGIGLVYCKEKGKVSEFEYRV